MRRNLFKAALPLVLITALLMSPSCIFDPKQEAEIPPVIEVTWPDMTDRDDVLETLVLAYANPKNGESTSKYNAILHTQYFFGLASQDVEVGDSPIISRSEDVTITEKMFEYELILELTLDPMIGTWVGETEVNGEPCENCWSCQPSYFIRAQFDDEKPLYMSPVTNSEVMIIVSPDEADPTKWVLRAMYDLAVTTPTN